MENNNKPRLFGITHSNRDFEQKETWGKNQFNSSFPASLSVYMHGLGMENIYLKLNKELEVFHSKISTNDLYGIDCMSDNIFFSFESVYSPYQQILIGDTPRVDLVIQDRRTSSIIKGIEIKLTALPDNTTCELSHQNFGSEIVIRPDTIVYLACSIALLYKDNIVDMQRFFDKDFDKITEWSNAESVLPYIKQMAKTIDEICMANIENQEPIVMQPIWKTEGKAPILSDHCLDIFIWSNLAFIQLFTEEVRKERDVAKISRQTRTLVWLFKMLFDFCHKGQFDHKAIIDELSYNTKNDKAFAVSGAATHPFMKSDELACPRITRNDVRNIILGGGQNLLSPERRFDAIIYNSPDLFK